MKKGFANIINYALGIAVLVILVSTVVLPQIFGANTTTWDSNTKTLWTDTTSPTISMGL